MFEQFGLKITAEANLHVANFLDVTFDLNSVKFKPYRKPNDDRLYMNIPFLTLSADEQTFHESAPIYQNALMHSNFDHKLQSWTKVVVTPTPSPRIQCCHVKSQFNIDLGGGCYNIFVQDCLTFVFPKIID